MNHTPLYEQLRERLLTGFPSPVSNPVHDGYFAFTLLRALDQVDALKGQAPVLGTPRDPDFDNAQAERLAHESKTIEAVLPALVGCLNGMLVWAHPQAQVNVIGSPSIASVVGAILPSIYNPNLCSEESGRGFSEAEVRASSMAADLVGYDPRLAGGLFTFGGTGTLLYGLKLGLETCSPGTLHAGLYEPAFVITSEQGHYGAANAASWLGLGKDRVLKVASHADNSMKLDDFEQILDQTLQSKAKVAGIVATMGTTDAFGIDDLAAIVAIRDRLVERHGLPYRPHVHADAVIGWAWSVFRGYDYDHNPLEFRGRTLRAIASIESRIRHLSLADSLGIDFHKTGFVPYISSLFLARDRDRYALLVRERGEMPYLYHTGAYHPGMYTLETSRSGTGPMSALASMLHLGREGLQTLLGHALEMAETLREAIAGRPELSVVNDDNLGPVTLFRAYRKGVDTFAVKTREMNDPTYASEVEYHNRLNRRIFELVQHAALEGKGVALGFTDCYRRTCTGQAVCAIKSYVISPFSTSDRMHAVVKQVLAALEAVTNGSQQ